MNTRRQMIVSACGRGGHGKTHFATTAPTPMQYLSIDPSTQDAFDQMEIGPDAGITLVEFKKPIPSFWGDTKHVQQDAQEQWEAFLKVNDDILNGKTKPSPQTVVWDTATEFYDTAILGEFGRTEQLLYYQRAIPNRIFSRLLDAYQSSGINLVLLHRLKERWVDEEKKVRTRGGGTEVKTERVRDASQPFEREGFKKIEYIIQAEVFLSKRDAQDGGDLSDRFGMKVMKCTRRPSLEEVEWWGKTKKGREKITFEWLYEAVFG